MGAGENPHGNSTTSQNDGIKTSAGENEDEGPGSLKEAALKDLANIKEDIEDLQEVKDIRDELSIMSALFHIQKEVLQTMDRALKNGDAPAPQNGRISFEASSLTNSTHCCPTSSKPVVDSPMLTAVNRNIEEVQRLDSFAERAATAVYNPLLVRIMTPQMRLTFYSTKQIQHLLDLKHKQANLLEEQLARQLNAEIGKQGKTIMYFTVVTTVFVC